MAARRGLLVDSKRMWIGSYYAEIQKPQMMSLLMMVLQGLEITKSVDVVLNLARLLVLALP
jgi:hypothetical protein